MKEAAADEPLRFDPVAPADAESLVAMARDFHREDGHALDAAGERALRRIAEGEPLAPAWILRDGKEPIGYLVITLGFSVEYGGTDGFIDDLYLAPQGRGRGLGRTIVAFALAEAARLGIRTLHLEVEPGNDKALDLYRAAGFEETGRRLMRRRIGAHEE